SRLSSLAELDAVQSACITLGIEVGLRPLKATLAENLPQLAILVGYSALHHELAGFFKQLAIPVILYEVTPKQALKAVKFEEAKDRIKVALSIHKAGSAFLRAAEIPYHYIGTPYRDRVAKVDIRASAFTFLTSKPLVTLYPGGYGEALQKMIPMFSQLAVGIHAANDCQIVVSLREELDFDQTVQEFKKYLPSTTLVSFVLGMHLELLSLSRLAVTGTGAITIEAAIARKPFLPIYDQEDEADEAGFFSLVNQSLGKKLVEEYSSQAPIKGLLTAIKNLLKEGSEHTAFLKKLEGAQSEFEGSAADNAADFIVQVIGLGRKRSKIPVTPQ
ncbi:MAG: hypothetical protein AAB288_07355, partial [Acidobacteriota bacterium]